MAKRKVWFITRPERDPQFHPEALKALHEATNGFSVKWVGNREAHLRYEQALIDFGLKRDHLSHDGSGGRTWAAMLKTFAYVYTDDEGRLVPTKVGEALLEGRKVHENITKQILTLQIPNAYFLEPGFRPPFEEGFRIRPARFLIKLTNQSALNYYLTKDEITFFALTAKRDTDLAHITQLVLRYRNASPEEQAEIRKEIAEKYDHRERSDRGAREYAAAHGDVAHTFMMLCDYTDLVKYIRSQHLAIDPDRNQEVAEFIAAYDRRYPFNTRYLISLQRMAQNNGLDVDSYKASDSEPAKPAARTRKLYRKIRGILANVSSLEGYSTTRVQELLVAEGVSPSDAKKYAFQVLTQVPRGLNEDFVESYLTEKDARAFEDKTAEVFRMLGFDVVMRPDPTASAATTRIEILLKYGTDYCGLIDAKKHDKFQLSPSLAALMSTEYLPNYDGYDGRKVGFFGYITSSDWSGERNLKKISEQARERFPDRNIAGIMLSAKVLLGFLDYCLERGLPPEDRVRLFLRAVQNRGYRTLGEMLEAAGAEDHSP